MSNKSIKSFYLSCSVVIVSCSGPNYNIAPTPTPYFPGIAGYSEVRITDKASIAIPVSNPKNHELEYKYLADRGRVLADTSPETIFGLPNTVFVLYHAPFTGGLDTVTLSVFDKTDNVNLPTISRNIQVQGESIAYVELTDPKKNLGDTENGSIKVASLRATTNQKDIGKGRTPEISPDGEYIAYNEYQVDGSSQIILQDSIGNKINLTTNDKSLNINPSWSPIGKNGNLWLVFSSNRGNDNKKFHLWKINIETKELAQITKEECNDLQPNWSPDGTKIVFVSNLDNNIEKDYNNIYLLDVQTNKRTQLTYENLINKGTYNPSWSLDNSKIVYTRKYQNTLNNKLINLQRIWMIDITKTSEDFSQIVTSEDDRNIVESFPSWSPNNRSITFLRIRDSEHALLSLDFFNLMRV